MKSIVLLKNESELLPLNKNNQTIALIGPLASDKNSSLGNWRSQAISNSATSVLEAMTNYSGNKLFYEKGVDFNTTTLDFHNRVNLNLDDRSEFNKAKTVAEKADIV